MPVPRSTADTVERTWACWSSTEAHAVGEPIGLQVLHNQQARVHHVFPIFHPPRPI